MTTSLDPHTRGTTFRYRFGFGGGWTWSDFSEIKFTLRKNVPPSTETTDTAAVAQATTGGGITVDADPAFFWVTFAASVNALWELGQLLWDVKATRASDGSRDQLDEGDIEIRPDMTRS